MKDGFDARTKQQIERLKKTKLSTLEAKIAEKRVRWFKNDYKRSTDLVVSPRSAYEMLFFDYMGLSEEEVPVVREDDNEIVWLSYNSCPTLEACKRLELNTRDVCRAVYEKSTQALISQLNPQLRFHRSYQEIRPYSEYCKEMIIRVDFEHYMQTAIEEARRSKAEGNDGYGAVVVFQNNVIGKAHDTVSTQKDPSLHAEVNAIRQAVNSLGDTNLCGSILFSTCEPCPMCASLAAWTNITTIVYGASIEETARLGRSRIRIGSEVVASRSPFMIEIIGNIRKETCMALYK